MPRTRHQNGWVEETGRRIKKWKGHFYVYVRQDNGSDKRKHRAVILGLKASMKKWEAERALQQVIDRETTNSPLRLEDATFEWFWHHRYLPMHGDSLRASSRKTLCWLMGRHILPAFGETPLEKLDRFELQRYLNALARKGYSRSLIHKVRTYLKAALGEAFEQDFIRKNPARKLEMPRTKDQPKRAHSEADVHLLLSELHGREHLIARILVLCGLRPGELFSLRWTDWTPGQLRVDESVWEGKLGKTKTENSTGFVALSSSLECELSWWYEQSGKPGSDSCIFPSQRDTPIARRNWMRRNLSPAAKRAKVVGVTYQSLRRTFATIMQKCGTVKDAQAQLRHTSPTLTVGVYMKAIPESVKAAVEVLDQKLTPVLNTNEHEFEM